MVAADKERCDSDTKKTKHDISSCGQQEKTVVFRVEKESVVLLQGCVFSFELILLTDGSQSDAKAERADYLILLDYYRASKVEWDQGWVRKF
jgi:hypothetical protein